MIDDLTKSFVKRNMIPAQYNLIPPFVKFCSEGYRTLASDPEKLKTSEFCTLVMEMFLPIFSLRQTQVKSVITNSMKSTTLTTVDFKLVSLFLPAIANTCSSFYSVWKVKNSMTIAVRQIKRFVFINRLNNACKKETLFPPRVLCHDCLCL